MAALVCFDKKCFLRDLDGISMEELSIQYQILCESKSVSGGD